MVKKEPHAAPYQLSGYLPVLVLQWPLAFALVRNLNDLSQPLQLILHEKFNSCFSADFQRSALKNRSINAATIVFFVFFFAFDCPLVWQDDARCILLNRVWKGFGNMAVRVPCVGETSISSWCLVLLILSTEFRVLHVPQWFRELFWFGTKWWTYLNFGRWFRNISNHCDSEIMLCMVDSVSVTFTSSICCGKAILARQNVEMRNFTLRRRNCDHVAETLCGDWAG